MIPVGVVLAAILHAAPALPIEARTRYAEDIADAVDDVETGLALVATASVESGFREKIERCECAKWECDGGAAFGIFQLHEHWLRERNAEGKLIRYTARDVCGSNRLAARLAANVIVTLRGLTSGGSMRMDLVFARYVGARPDDDRVMARWSLFETLMEIQGDA